MPLQLQATQSSDHEIVNIWQRNRTTVIWITNDPDEAILVAEHAIPLLPGANGATLGTQIPVAIPARPCDRKQVLKTLEFKNLKLQLVNTLLDAKKDCTSTIVKKLAVPDIHPEDLAHKRASTLLNRPKPPPPFTVSA